VVAAPRTRQPRSAAVRSRILAAALATFAARGFEASSTRDIAAAARTHQPQINYHFGSKFGLWQAVMDSLFAELDEALADVGAAGDQPQEILGRTCAEFVRFAARRPELNRIMVHESTVPSVRLDWLVETHVRHRFVALSRLCARLDPASVPTTDPLITYYALVGAGSLLAVNANEARLLVGRDPLEGRVEAYAAAIAAMVLGPAPRSLPA
jgi:AcrR family transcriptional regulator